MNTDDIILAYVSWGAGGKIRPILILGMNADSLVAFRITSQYDNKNPKIQSNYFKIQDFVSAGLKKQSYVDTGDRVEVFPEDIKAQVGTLSPADQTRLALFLQQHDK